MQGEQQTGETDGRDASEEDELRDHDTQCPNAPIQPWTCFQKVMNTHITTTLFFTTKNASLDKG